MTCEFSKICWRYAYSRFLLERGWAEIPPDRWVLFWQGYASQEMMPRGGVYAEILPHRAVDGGFVGLCPIIACRGRVEECREWQKEKKRREHAQKHQHFSQAQRREWLPTAVRREVAARDKYSCVYCGANVQRIKCVVDHIVPLARGGGNEIENLALSCVKCNSEKRTEIWQKGCKKHE